MIYPSFVRSSPGVGQRGVGYLKEITMSERAPVAMSLGIDTTQLQTLISAVQADPQTGKTVWRATTAWQHGFQSQATIRNFTVPMDEPTMLGGSDTAPNMVEMVLAAYGCCLTTGYVLQAALRGLALEQVEIELEGDLDLNGFFGLAAETWPGYTDVRAVVHLAAPNATPEQLQALHTAVTETSPVGCILQRPVRLSVELAAA
jgi:uncharacterized OsmC-like protein